MSAARSLQTTARRLAIQRPGTLSLNRFASPVAIATNNAFVQYRPATTASLPSSQQDDILIAQRKNRPVSPHLTIYQPQITWYPSALNRITGCILSGAFYVFGVGYLAAPLLGWHWEAASIAATFAALPFAAKVGIKSFFAWPFVFHSVNGLRHLGWDMTIGISNKTVARTGWAAVIASVVGTVYIMAAY